MITFVTAVLAVGKAYRDLKKFAINVNGLEEFLRNGRVPGVGDESLLAKITGRVKDSGHVNGTDPGKLDKNEKEGVRPPEDIGRSGTQESCKLLYWCSGIR